MSSAGAVRRRSSPVRRPPSPVKKTTQVNHKVVRRTVRRSSSSSSSGSSSARGRRSGGAWLLFGLGASLALNAAFAVYFIVYGLAGLSGGDDQVPVGSRAVVPSSAPADIFLGGPSGVRSFMEGAGPPDVTRKFIFFHKPNHHGIHFYRKILAGNGWTEARSYKETLASPNPVFTFLTRAPSVWKTNYSFFEEGKHIVNHFPGDRVPFNKEPFFLNLKNYGRVHGCDYTQLHPETFRLHDAGDVAEVLRVEADEWDHRNDNTWFTKVLEGTFGIGVDSTNLTAFRRKFARRTDFSQPITDPAQRKNVAKRIARKVASRQGLLLQRAVIPFLTEGRKFDIRTHLLIANFKPFYVYYNTKSAYLRRSTVKFDLSSTTKGGHVTNSHNQMHEEGFDPLDHLWGVQTTFRRYLLSLGFSQEQFEEMFEAQMKKLMLGLFYSFKEKVNRAHGYFLILGVDVIVDENMHLKILEANTNPAMRYDVELVGTEATKRFWNMSHEALNLVYEVYQKTSPNRPAPLSYDPLAMESARDFELIYTDDEQLRRPWAVSEETCFVQDKIFKPVNPPTVWWGE